MMKRRSRVALALVFAAAVQTAAIAAAMRSILQVRGKTAIGSFTEREEIRDASGAVVQVIETTTTVIATNERKIEPPQPGRPEYEPFLQLFVVRKDVTNPEEPYILLDASGSTDTFSFAWDNGALEPAQVKGTVLLRNQATGPGEFLTTVNVTFTPEGQLQTCPPNHDHLSVPGYRANFHLVGRHAPATAEGSIVGLDEDGQSVDYIAGVTGTGELQMNRSGSIEIFK